MELRMSRETKRFIAHTIVAVNVAAWIYLALVGGAEGAQKAGPCPTPRAKYDGKLGPARPGPVDRHRPVCVPPRVALACLGSPIVTCWASADQPGLLWVWDSPDLVSSRPAGAWGSEADFSQASQVTVTGINRCGASASATVLD